ncbi:MAG: HAD-IB family hydrolase [Flavitalea sp.]
MSKRIAFFDFDGTITTKDTLLEFIKFCKGKPAFYSGFMLNAHYLVGFKAGIITNQRAKERILEYFFKNTSVNDFREFCLRFSTEALPALIRPGAISEIERLKAEGTDVVIVTASAEDWVKPWTDAMGVRLMGTRLELVKEKITGKIKDINCYGEEKVRRIKEQYQLTDYERIFAYGDTSGDKPMLGIAHESFYKPFRS